MYSQTRPPLHLSQRPALHLNQLRHQPRSLHLLQDQRLRPHHSPPLHRPLSPLRLPVARRLPVT